MTSGMIAISLVQRDSWLELWLDKNKEFIDEMVNTAYENWNTTWIYEHQL